jgi:membrane protease YdiL (CAAX protease family)
MTLRVSDVDGYLTGSPWRGIHVAAVLLGWFFGAYLGFVAATLLGVDPLEDAAGLTAGVVAQALAGFGVVWMVSRAMGTGSLSTDVGLRLRWVDTVGVLGGIVLQFAVALALSPLVRFLLPDIDTQQQVAEVAEQTDDAGGRILLIFTVVIVAPIIEEIIFRGVLLSWLSKRVRPWPAILWSSASFAAIHLLDPNAVLAVPGLFMIGIALGWAAMRWQSLSLPIFLHAGVNLTGVLILIFGDDLLDWLEELQSELEAVVHIVLGG